MKKIKRKLNTTIINGIYLLALLAFIVSSCEKNVDLRNSASEDVRFSFKFSEESFVHTKGGNLSNPTPIIYKEKIKMEDDMIAEIAVCEDFSQRNNIQTRAGENFPNHNTDRVQYLVPGFYRIYASFNKDSKDQERVLEGKVDETGNFTFWDFAKDEAQTDITKMILPSGIPIDIIAIGNTNRKQIEELVTSTLGLFSGVDMTKGAVMLRGDNTYVTVSDKSTITLPEEPNGLEPTEANAETVEIPLLMRHWQGGIKTVFASKIGEITAYNKMEISFDNNRELYYFVDAKKAAVAKTSIDEAITKSNFSHNSTLQFFSSPEEKTNATNTKETNATTGAVEYSSYYKYLLPYESSNGIKISFSVSINNNGTVKIYSKENYELKAFPAQFKKNHRYILKITISAAGENDYPAMYVADFNVGKTDHSFALDNTITSGYYGVNDLSVFSSITNMTDYNGNSVEGTFHLPSEQEWLGILPFAGVFNGAMNATYEVAENIYFKGEARWYNGEYKLVKNDNDFARTYLYGIKLMKNTTQANGFPDDSRKCAYRYSYLGITDDDKTNDRVVIDVKYLGTKAEYANITVDDIASEEWWLTNGTSRQAISLPLCGYLGTSPYKGYYDNVKDRLLTWGTIGSYWSSSPADNYPNMRSTAHLGKDNIYCDEDLDPASHGLTVRLFKDDPDAVIGVDMDYDVNINDQIRGIDQTF